MGWFQITKSSLVSDKYRSEVALKIDAVKDRGVKGEGGSSRIIIIIIVINWPKPKILAVAKIKAAPLFSIILRP